MTAPGVGPVDPRAGLALCSYTTPGGTVACDRQAARHVLVADRFNSVPKALAACFGHLPIARVAGVFLQEHTHEDCCGMPGTVWDTKLNRCVLDDTGIELPLREKETARA